MLSTQDYFKIIASGILSGFISKQNYNDTVV